MPEFAGGTYKANKVMLALIKISELVRVAKAQDFVFWYCKP
jgi:hypothetical protein